MSCVCLDPKRQAKPKKQLLFIQVNLGAVQEII